MNFLPIAARELRVVARKRSGFWLRVGAAGAAVVLGAGLLLLSELQGIRSTQIGTALFNVLAWSCLAAGLSAGLFLTSDCLSQEKREGTLGLLFLTELRGYDVVLGKLLATSLRGFYAVLAVLPILAVTVLMGGITGAQYWKSALALPNCLFLSLSAGMFISALSRDSQKALGATLLLLLLLAAGGPLADALIGDIKKRPFQPLCSLTSPAYVLAAAGAWGRSSYWSGLLTTHILAWAMFAIACAVVPRAWQEHKSVGFESSRGWRYALRHGNAKSREKIRGRLLGRHPIIWLACQDRWQTRALWVMAILAAGGFAATLLSNAPREAWMAWMYVGGLFTLMLYLWAASQACRFLGEARRSGFLELLLVTPLGERQIVRGHWRALLRMFGLPVLLLLGVHVAGATLSQPAFHRLAAQMPPPVATPAGTNQGTVFVTNVTIAAGPRRFTVTTSASNQTNAVSGRRTVTATATLADRAAPGGAPSLSRFQQAGMAAGAAAAAVLGTAANLLAICWFGMWMGMTSRSANLATLKTIVFVQVIPWFVIAFVTSIVLGLAMALLFGRSGMNASTTWIAWWPLLSASLGAILAVGKDIVFILWSRGRLYSGLHQEAGRVLGLPRLSARVPGPVSLPPS